MPGGGVRLVALVVLDGWGCAPAGPGNAVSLARTPVFDRLWSERKSFDYQGKNYNLKAAFNQPHGVQARPVLLNAGRSPRGGDARERSTVRLAGR